jgi:hypothetical protein
MPKLANLRVMKEVCPHWGRHSEEWIKHT